MIESMERAWMILKWGNLKPVFVWTLISCWPLGSYSSELTSVSTESPLSRKGYMKYANYIDGCPECPEHSWAKDIQQDTPQRDVWRLCSWRCHRECSIYCFICVAIILRSSIIPRINPPIQRRTLRSNPPLLMNKPSFQVVMLLGTSLWVVIWKRIWLLLKICWIVWFLLLHSWNLERTFQVEMLYMFEYESSLKRMTVIIKLEDKVRVYCKVCYSFPSSSSRVQIVQSLSCWTCPTLRTLRLYWTS